MSLTAIFATDDGFVFQTLVAASSLIRNGGINDLDVVILTKANDLSKKSRMQINAVESKYQTSIKVFEIDESKIAGAKSKIPHISQPTFYRLLAPSLLQNKDRCLYLDGDIVVSSSIEPFVSEIGLDDSSWDVKGVLAPYMFASTKQERARSRLKSFIYRVPVLRFEEYINAGVLLMNLKSMRSRGVEGLLKSYITKGFHDQDAINMACRGRIALADCRFNTPVCYFQLENGLVKCASDNKATQTFGTKAIQETIANPAILHFAGPNKPWNVENLPFAEVWTREADQVKEIIQGI
ncbi:glycosyltransferase family 8 protein [uncultured Slackia sp.]|uniref:glycosyltransferase family 8 protein n=1 Tax=uncultured Slackia sp. TaxID=665903 RepID=UPI0025D356FD|nr:glycosyltransferase family 8 protein [uncultured Slackia sp.]